MKRKWWVILLAVVLVVAVAAYALWDTVLVYAAPKVALTTALSKTAEALQERLEGSPLTVLTKALDGEGKNTIALQLDTSNDILGSIGYNMTVQMENAPRRIAAQGMVTTGSGTIDLSVYMDGSFMAVSSDSLLEGSYYGITYDTFSQDIRGNKLLSLFLPESTIEQWETSIAALQETMEKSYEMPELTEKDIQMILGGVMAMKADVSAETLTVNGQALRCHKVSFTSTGPEIGAAAQEYMAQMTPELQELVTKLKNSADSSVTADFWIQKDAVVKLSFTLRLEDGETVLEGQTGPDAKDDDIVMSLVSREDGDLKRQSITVSTTRSEGQYAEQLQIVTTENGVQDKTVIDYAWSRESGELPVSLVQGAGDTAMTLNLQETGDGFRLETGQFEVLMGALSGESKTGNSHCIMTVTKGADIETPDYKNFDTWSIDDLLVLLGGIGGLFGLGIG